MVARLDTASAGRRVRYAANISAEKKAEKKGTRFPCEDEDAHGQAGA